jgi:hypothetical protein
MQISKNEPFTVDCHPWTVEGKVEDSSSSRLRYIAASEF